MEYKNGMSDVTQVSDWQGENGRFKTGNIGGPGRPKGARNKLGEAMIDDLYQDWIRHGIQAIEEVRRKFPSDYLKIIALLVSKVPDLGAGIADAVHAQELELIIEGRRQQALLTIEKMKDGYG